jgi:hypothetical protein
MILAQMSLRCGVPKLKGVVRYGTSVETAEYVDVAIRARELGCRVPTGTALLPGNFATAADIGEFRFHPAVSDVRSAWRNVRLIDTGPYQKPPPTDEPVRKPADESVPLVVFFGLSIDPADVLLALGTAATILTSHPSTGVAREAVFDAVVERPNSRGYTCLKCRGFASDVVTLAEPVQKIREAR